MASPLNEIDQRHFSVVTKAVFTPRAGGKPPAWLQAQFDSCATHYQDFLITPGFRAALEQFHTQQEQPFEVFVVGEGNFGKSTMVNALVGHQISEVDFRPETRSFLRYVLHSTPSPTATLYVRLLAGMHDQFREWLGDGEPCKEIYDVMRYRLPRKDADRFLSMDSTNCREMESSYTPAILEIERELQWTPASLFPEGVRLVDTQGLNQIFGDDLLKQSADLDPVNSAQLFDDWMAKSPRGRHLDWQFRRCHVVLWLVSAQKPSSGATRAAMRYLGKYGKNTVLAVTQVDRVKGGPEQIERVLQEIRSQFGEFGSELLPMNARLAMQSSLKRDQAGIQASGLETMVTRLKTLCLEDAGRVRAISQYNSLRATEGQMRQSIQTMLGSLNDIQDRLANLRKLVESSKTSELSSVRCALQQGCGQQLREIKSRVENVGLMDNTESALSIIQLDVARVNTENAVRSACMLAEPRLKELTGNLRSQRFSLPSFDAEGREFGEVVTAGLNSSMESITIPGLTLSLALDVRPIKAAKIWLLKKIRFARDSAESEERKLNWERRGELNAEIDRKWETFQTNITDQVTNQIWEAFQRLTDGLRNLEIEIEAVDKRPLTESTRRLTEIASIRCVQSPFLTTMVTALRGVVARSRRFEAGAAKLKRR